MKRKLITLSLVMVTLSSFMCSKQESMRTQSDVTFDFTLLPASSTITITGNNGEGSWKLNSDSLKVFNITVPQGTYNIKWQMFNVPRDYTQVAVMTGFNYEVTMPWDDGIVNGNNWKLDGSFVLTKRKR